jgi:hypothetical protein
VLQGDCPPEGSVSTQIAELALPSDGRSATAGRLLLPVNPEGEQVTP